MQFSLIAVFLALSKSIFIDVLLWWLIREIYTNTLLFCKMAQRPSIFKLASQKRVSNNSFVLKDLENLGENYKKMNTIAQKFYTWRMISLEDKEIKMIRLSPRWKNYWSLMRTKINYLSEKVIAENNRLIL